MTKRAEHARRRDLATSVDKAIAILILLGREMRHAGVREIGRQLGISPSTVHRLLASFVAHGLVQHVDGEYRLGWACVDLGRRVLSETGIPRTGRAVADQIRDKTGETVTIQVPVDSEQVCVVEAEGLHELNWRVGVGRRMQLHAGASGRAILAHRPAESIEAYIQKGLSRIGPNSITDPQTLRRTLDETRALGFAVSRGEARAAVVAVAAPIFDEHRAVVGSISISGPEERFSPDVVARLIPEVVEAARRLSRDLGTPAVEAAPAGTRRRNKTGREAAVR